MFSSKVFLLDCFMESTCNGFKRSLTKIIANLLYLNFHHGCKSATMLVSNDKIPSFLLIDPPALIF